MNDNLDRYIIRDKTGKCFVKFSKMNEICKSLAIRYLYSETPISIGIMLCLKDALIQAGFKYDKDFYITKL